MNIKPTLFKYILPGFLVLIPLKISAQTPVTENINILLQRLAKLKPDTTRVNTLSKIALYYINIDRDKALRYVNEEQQLANQLNFTRGQVIAYENMGYAAYNFSKFQQELDFYKQGYNLANANNLSYLKSQLLTDMGYAYENIKNYNEAIKNFEAAAQGYLQMKGLKAVSNAADGTMEEMPWFEPASRAIFDYSLYLRNDSSGLGICRQILNKQLHENDTAGIRSALSLFVEFYKRKHTSEALKFADEELRYFKPGDTTARHGSALMLNAGLYTKLKNYTKAMEYYRAAITFNPRNAGVRDMANEGMSYIYRALEDYNKAFKLDLERYKSLPKPVAYSDKMFSVYGPFIGDCIELKKYDRALSYLNELLQVLDKANAFDAKATYLSSLAEVYYYMHRYDDAMHAIKESLALNPEAGGKSMDLNWLGILIRDAPVDVLKKYGIQPTSRYPLAIKNMRLALDFFKQGHWDKLALTLYKELSTTYELTKDYKNYHDTYKQYITLRDSSVNRTNQNAFINKLDDIEYQKKEDELKYQQRLANESAAQQKKYYISGIIALLAVALLVAWNYSNQRKANKSLGRQQTEIAKQRDQLIETVSDLKKAQQQLIQTEKMASLGELTAGIAHEIQNPLNFVNNFSDVNREMLAELKEALQTGDIEEAITIAGDIEQNEEKINHHGKRADGIVKGMLEHSRAATGKKEPTDINKLADEYMRLAYHGLRAKDKTFNAELITSFEPNLPLVNIIPQDIGRVLLNLFNNSFYAVQQKQKVAGADFKPMVEITTFALPSGGWGVSVKDNGTGIPDAIKEKVMQPFFTTKPTGQGTGLGLSLSYDIVVKGHGGNITVNSKPGEGAQFVIQIPSV